MINKQVQIVWSNCLHPQCKDPKDTGVENRSITRKIPKQNIQPHNTLIRIMCKDTVNGLKHLHFHLCKHFSSVDIVELHGLCYSPGTLGVKINKAQDLLTF